MKAAMNPQSEEQIMMKSPNPNSPKMKMMTRPNMMNSQRWSSPSGASVLCVRWIRLTCCPMQKGRKKSRAVPRRLLLTLLFVDESPLYTTFQNLIGPNCGRRWQWQGVFQPAIFQFPPGLRDLGAPWPIPIPIACAFDRLQRFPTVQLWWWQWRGQGWVLHPELYCDLLCYKVFRKRFVGLHWRQCWSSLTAYGQMFRIDIQVFWMCFRQV